MSHTRLDAVLVRRCLARSRGHARDLIADGAVRVNGTVASKPAQPVSEGCLVEVVDTGRSWVGRGAHKLVAALKHWPLLSDAVVGARCIDVGASTGGFTEVLLASGASQVAAVDVGHGQLAVTLRADARVVDFSGVSVRGLDPARVGGSAQVVVADLSFISVTVVASDLARLVLPGGHLMVLVKPQFEVGRDRLGKKGLVRAAADRGRALRSVAAAVEGCGLGICGLAHSPIDGSTGNVEYLVWAMSPPCAKMDPESVAAAIDSLTGDPTRDPRTRGGHA